MNDSGSLTADQTASGRTGFVDRAVLARALPFALFMLVLAIRGELPQPLSLWLYAVQAGLAALVLAYFWREYSELRVARPSWQPQACAAGLLLGVLVFVLWIYLDFAPLNLGVSVAVAPPMLDGVPDWRWIALRLAGAALVVPVMEELFWRSFVMRWLESRHFLQVQPLAVSLRSLLVAALVFGLEHHLWFAGLLAGLVYAWLYRRFGLWTAIFSHAVTNLSLGLWVWHSGQWQFW
ncbi:CAAX prenyl protease-related protein [Viridibacterium curvum]|uniref:CAAX prenyl protease-related protein n=1 Tax=Viridibacterium curvum TaxID=1101404 RepID=A0ABP9QKN9_9RHOO